MHRTAVQTVAAAAMLFALVTACGSGDSDDSGDQSGDTSATASASDGAGGADASAGVDASGGAGVQGDAATEQVNTAIQQALQASPVTFTPESAELSESSKGTLKTIAQALQGNDVKLKVATSAGYPDAAQSKTLSEQRAQAIVSALEGFGVTKDRVQTEATGNENAQGAQAMKTQISVA